jgi:predicted transcriptional regulator YheO
MNERQMIFENLKNLADFTVQTFGHNCEVAVHDLRDPEHSLVHIAGKVTHRNPGAPITDLVVKALRREGDSAKNIVNYQTKSGNGRILKSSTNFIRDSRGKVIGAFCINFDLTDYLNSQALIGDLIKTVSLEQNKKTETFANSADQTVDSLIEESVAKMGKQPSTMSKEEKVRMVGILENMGAFIIKGAVDSVALALGVSKYSVYNYLKKIRVKSTKGVDLSY